MKGAVRSQGLREVGREAAAAAERAVLAEVLWVTRWNRAETARRLKISYRTLLTKIRAYRLDVDE